MRCRPSPPSLKFNPPIHYQTIHHKPGLIDLVPPVPDAIKVCVFPPSFLFRSDLHVHPHLLNNPAADSATATTTTSKGAAASGAAAEFPFSVAQLLRWAFVAPADDADIERLYALGQQVRPCAWDSGGWTASEEVVRGALLTWPYQISLVKLHSGGTGVAGDGRHPGREGDRCRGGERIFSTDPHYIYTYIYTYIYIIYIHYIYTYIYIYITNLTRVTLFISTSQSQALEDDKGRRVVPANAAALAALAAASGPGTGGPIKEKEEDRPSGLGRGGDQWKGG